MPASSDNPRYLVTQQEELSVEPNIRVVRSHTWEAHLPESARVHAHFVREGTLARIKRRFTHPIEAGALPFDDRVYVVTSTPEETRRLIQQPAVQRALIALVNPTRHVEIEGNLVRVLDVDAVEGETEVTGPLLELAALAANTRP